MEKKISSKEIVVGHIFSVTHDQVLVEKNQKIATREIVHHHGGVGIAVCQDHKILLVKQYRYAINAYTLEIPAGKLENDEDPKERALKEIEEETGYQAEDITVLTKVYATPGYCTEMLHIYYTQHVHKVENPRPCDEDEDIIYEWYDIDDCLNMISKQEIVDAKTVIAILALKVKFNS